MSKNPLLIFLTILLFFTITFVACNTDKPHTTPKNSKIEESNLSKEKAIVPTQKSEIKKDPTVVNKVIGVFSTPLLDKHKNRISNIKQAAKKINNYILKPGAVFSFNGVVGKRIPEKGYKKARILVDGERDTDIGGGICQLSSTLYNAAKKVNLKITERHTHSADVHYLPIGQDAAVNYNDKDLKFINIKNYPIQIRIKVQKNYLTVSISSHKSVPISTTNE